MIKRGEKKFFFLHKEYNNSLRLKRINCTIKRIMTMMKMCITSDLIKGREKINNRKKEVIQ